jgi:hypothetical protein
MPIAARSPSDGIPVRNASPLSSRRQNRVICVRTDQVTFAATRRAYSAGRSAGGRIASCHIPRTTLPEWLDHAPTPAAVATEPVTRAGCVIRPGSGADPPAEPIAFNSRLSWYSSASRAEPHSPRLPRARSR